MTGLGSNLAADAKVLPRHPATSLLPQHHSNLYTPLLIDQCCRNCADHDVAAHHFAAVPAVADVGGLPEHGVQQARAMSHSRHQLPAHVNRSV
jgi:hypothetical protein